MIVTETRGNATRISDREDGDDSRHRSGVTLIHQPGSIAVLASLYTYKDYRRQGRATAVIQEAARIVGMGELALQVDTYNAVAIALYHKLGFVDSDCPKHLPDVPWSWPEQDSPWMRVQAEKLLEERNECR